MQALADAQTKSTMSKCHCCVPECVSDSRYDPDKKLSFHQFPKDTSLRKAWIKKIRRDIGPLFQITESTRVCSKHFKPYVFIKTLTGRKKLKPNTIPTEFTWQTKTISRRASRKRRRSSSSGSSSGEDILLTEAAEPSEEDTSSTPCTTDHDYGCSKTADEMLTACRERIAELEQQVENFKAKTFCLERFSADAQIIQFYTGFQDYATLKAAYLTLQPTATTMTRWTQVHCQNGQQSTIKQDVFRDETLPLIDQFFMFLCRVKQGFVEQDLALRFNVSQPTCIRILITWANYLYFMLDSLPVWCSRETIQQKMPQCFRQTYPNTRVILDVTEIRAQTPSSKVLHSETYSNCKSYTTLKSLIGICPFGAVTFVSSLYTGCISDNEITSRSGILDLLEEGDEVMADDGFTINDLLQARKATLVIPPFLELKGKFIKKEETPTHNVELLRIYVERAIRRVKEYHIFDSVIPLSLAGCANQLWTVCAMLSNYKHIL